MPQIILWSNLLTEYYQNITQLKFITNIVYYIYYQPMFELGDWNIFCGWYQNIISWTILLGYQIHFSENQKYWNFQKHT